MRVLAYIHTYNDAAVIEQALDSLRRQTRQPDAIVVVDNASTDSTLDRTFPDGVTVIRNSVNMGPSGAVGIGLTLAQQKGFDWVWVLDADSVPEPEALANLIAFYEKLPPPEQHKVFFLACRLVTATGLPRDFPAVFTDTSIECVDLNTTADHIKCDCFIWAGSMFRMAAVGKIGLPSEDYVIDVGELEYGYRAMQLGFQSYMVTGAVLHQDVGRGPGVAAKSWRLGPFSIRLLEASPLRCYYHVRNMLNFWLYQCRPLKPRWVAWSVIHGLAYPRTFLLRPFTHHRQLAASLRGFWDGVTNHMERRY